MNQDAVTKNFVDHDEKIRNYTLNTTFVLITCDIGEEGPILKKISTLNPVREICQTMGQYDIIVKFEGINRTELAELINKEIRSIKTVRSVMTLMPISLA
ncbi:MAG: Lrp/AsnC family transcriptional regulator [Thaumarchaeota archaeon]|nr:MAG: Lrp/AsnC family transcriptional regulator [Nitrososphaerota archaeon]